MKLFKFFRCLFLGHKYQRKIMEYAGFKVQYERCVKCGKVKEV